MLEVSSVFGALQDALHVSHPSLVTTHHRQAIHHILASTNHMSQNALPSYCGMLPHEQPSFRFTLGKMYSVGTRAITNERVRSCLGAREAHCIERERKIAFELK